MLVAYPDGIGSSFNAGACCGTASSSNVDDVGFARELVRDLSEKMCVDPKRVYATGMSNGGHMAHRIACEAADVFAATASVAGKMLVAPCNPSRPISIVQWHGTEDTIVTYNALPPVVPMMENWASRNGCDPTPQTTYDEGRHPLPDLAKLQRRRRDDAVHDRGRRPLLAGERLVRLRPQLDTAPRQRRDRDDVRRAADAVINRRAGPRR